MLGGPVGPEATSAHSFMPPDDSTDTPPAVYRFNEPQVVPSVHMPVATVLGFLQGLAPQGVNVVSFVSLPAQVVHTEEKSIIVTGEDVLPTNMLLMSKKHNRGEGISSGIKVALMIL